MNESHIHSTRLQQEATVATRIGIRHEGGSRIRPHTLFRTTDREGLLQRRMLTSLRARNATRRVIDWVMDSETIAHTPRVNELDTARLTLTSGMI